MQKHQVEYIEFNITTDRRNDLLDLEDDPDHPNVKNRGDIVRINFSVDEQIQRAGVKKPRVDTIEALKVAFVIYLK